MTLATVSNNSLAIFEQMGQQANRAAEMHAFEEWKTRRAINTIKRAERELMDFSIFLAEIQNAEPLQLFTDPNAWQGITWGLVKAFIQDMLKNGYAIGTVNLHLSTIKTFAKLATAAGVLSTEELAMIQIVAGYSHKEGGRIDDKRETADISTRRGYKKADFTALSSVQAAQIKAQPETATAQGKRDLVILTIFLGLGLRVGELAALTADNFDLDAGTITFYREKVSKTQTHELPAETLAAVREYLATDHQGGNLALLRGSQRGGNLGKYGMSVQAISDRVRFYGRAIGIVNLSAHDLRHSWATLAAKAGTDLNNLMSAGGWASYAMPMRYIESSKIANEGVNL